MKNKKRSPQSCIELRFTRDPQKGHLPVNEAASSLTVPETSRSLKLTAPRNMADFLALRPCERLAQIPQESSDPLLCRAARSSAAGSQLHLVTTRRQQSSHTTSTFFAIPTCTLQNKS
ncbi:uncharacterized protein LOC144037813 isoform X1 [Vanacampus margaritifer]